MSADLSQFLERIEKRCERAVAEGAVDDLNGCVSELNSGLKGGEEATPQLPSDRSRLLLMRGKTKIFIFRLSGDAKQVSEAVADHREAASLLENSSRESLKREAQIALALSLYEQGQVDYDRSILAESLEILSILLGEISFVDAAPRWHRSILIHCSVRATLGNFNGDIRLVEEAIVDLIEFRKNLRLDDATKLQIVKITYARSFEVAFQNGCAEGFNDLIEEMKAEEAFRSADPILYQTILSNSRMELSRMTRSFDTIQEAICDVCQLCDLLKEKRNFRRLFDALQLRAQCYRIAGELKPDRGVEFALEAIVSVDEALEIQSAETDDGGARVVRLLFDRAGYYFALGKSQENKEYFEKSRNDYQTSLASLIPSQGPRLYSMISLGYFSACVALERWEEAIAAFDECEKAGLVAALDRGVSSQFHIQRFREIAQYYVYLAECHLKMGCLPAAVEAIERGRGQQLKLTFSPDEKSFGVQSQGENTELRNALDVWEDFRRNGSDLDCARSWQRYADLLRRQGYEMAIPTLNSDEIFSRLPTGGALVYLFVVNSTFEILVLLQDRTGIKRLTIDKNDYLAVNAILNGGTESGSDTWATAYQKFSRPEVEGRPEDELFRDWHEAVSVTMETLGRHLMQNLHDFLLEKRLDVNSEILLCLPGEFAALPTAKAILEGGLIFSDHWQVSLVPNAALIKSLSNEMVCESKSLLLISSDEAHPIAGEDDLPYAAREVEELRSQFVPTATTDLCGKKATLEAALEGLKKAGTIHIACHGTYQWRVPEESAINLPSGEKLSIGRMRPSSEFRMKARLVFLSCCESGISGQTIPPDEFVGLLPSFLQCGAQAAIGALWPVYDDAAMLLCQKFYRCYLNENGSEKMPPSRALSQAQAWLRGVTVGELIEGKILSREKIIQLKNERLGTVRLRGESRESVEHCPVPEREEREQELLDHSFRLYHSPVDWAPFIIVGR